MACALEGQFHHALLRIGTLFASFHQCFLNVMPRSPIRAALVLPSCILGRFAAIRYPPCRSVHSSACTVRIGISWIIQPTVDFSILSSLLRIATRAWWIVISFPSASITTASTCVATCPTAHFSLGTSSLVSFAIIVCTCCILFSQKGLNVRPCDGRNGDRKSTRLNSSHS